MNPYRQERLDSVAVPAHLLVFVHAFGHDFVHGRFGEGG
jgi:hypothetical protein